MNELPFSPTPATPTDLERSTLAFGRQIFREMGRDAPSPLSPRFWNQKLMGLSMQMPDFKVNLFRLVDVLPTLTSPQSIADHLVAYLRDPCERVHPSLGWFVTLAKHPLLAPLAALTVRLGVRQMASMFIAGNSPSSALPVLRALRGNRFAFTVDLLGEFCVCEREADEYKARYLEALDVFGERIPSWKEGTPILNGHPGETSPVCISVKLSALYSQTGVLNFDKSVAVLAGHLTEIARKARKYGALLYVDAEDTANNSIIYEAFTRVFCSPEFIDFPYPGIVVQAYSRDSESRVNKLFECARKRESPVAIRLVKGAYWDLERVVSAQNHWNFPLWGRKVSSDAHYEHLSRLLLDNTNLCLPAFGSHNIRSLSHACCYAESKGIKPTEFEIQVLYGMAEPIAQAFTNRGYLVRMYVPLGEVVPGMGYLVRRLLENTSNESFLRHTFFDEREVDYLLQQPRMHVEDVARAAPLTTCTSVTAS
jgi:RHH-type proline utilization regulon transcriptional repressor/proline dehydrogenase/delta 1-pyrroline-5-carboxylate dehydrogenase